MERDSESAQGFNSSKSGRNVCPHVKGNSFLHIWDTAPSAAFEQYCNSLNFPSDRDKKPERDDISSSTGPSTLFFLFIASNIKKTNKRGIKNVTRHERNCSKTAGVKMFASQFAARIGIFFITENDAR